MRGMFRAEAVRQSMLMLAASQQLPSLACAGPAFRYEPDKDVTYDDLKSTELTSVFG